MLLKRDLLETVTIISCSGTILCIILNYISNISPITGIYFLIYILFLFITSLFISFKLIQWLLHLNKPIKYDIEKLVLKYPFMSFIGDVLPKLQKKVERETKEYDTNELSVITTVLEKKLVSSWYVPYISEEIGFPFACKQMLDQMIAKAFEICNKIDNKDVFVDMCTILTSHLKEYKKALKRHETCPEESIESLYKKTHPIFNRKNKKTASADHCTDVLRIILKDLVPWELWDTPYSELLIRILAKKLDTFIETTIANPIWLNDRLITLLTKEQIKTEIEKEAKSNSIENVTTEARADKCNDKTEVIQSKADDIKSNVVEKKEAKKDNDVSQGTEPIDVKPVLRQRRGRQGRNEVKIYDRIIEGSVKTWETDMDLQCISVGQDLLASLDEMTLSRLWGHEEADHSPNMRTVSPQPLWFGEEDTMEFDLESGQSKKDSSPKPAELLRDLQSTVHQAKARIGDLQVPYIDVTRNNSDEAAGMMEGLFDKGIAGIKKGLRFTGLSDDSQEKQDKSPAHRGSEKVSPELQRHKIKSEVSEAQEAYTTMGTPKEENDLSHHLVKQQRITSQDSVMVRLPAWSPHSSSPPSPEPQYEEAADLSASIAKLRSLLQHAGPSAEEVWWEGAEETRGRPATNITRPPDTAALADEYDMNLERNASPGQTTNNMQRLDKLFTRTVTGVFNSIRTAVGAEGEGPAGGPSGGAVRGPLADWTYVSTSPELSVCSAAGRVVGSRRALWHVDSALDSLHQLGSKEVEDPRPLDLEEWLCVCGGRWTGLLEVCAALGLMSTHLAFRLTTVLCADTAESVIGSCLDDWSSSLKKQVFVYFEQLAADTSEQHERQLREFDVEETCNVIMKNIPEWCVLSDERARYAVRTAVCSMQHAPVLRDVLHRAMDALAGRARAAGGQH